MRTPKWQRSAIVGNERIGHPGSTLNMLHARPQSNWSSGPGIGAAEVFLGETGVDGSQAMEVMEL